ncbi:GNAT family N-acetyltransferase [Oceanotoga teriensis]|uniref:GNAT family N-acetyltransferase n=1 Tax=Oceanotoga teriensis TaxID=515440 RepID=UPI002712EE86|nr:GNAT family protein [Oceanotoga teriensis]MDO7975846.1 GNAT family N-acetyltransferase [Oceanotoga teriensis]
MNKIRLRDLKISDIDYMREFVENDEISKNFVFTRYPYSKEKMVSFIKSSWEDKNNVHYAITDENDNYIGTVSLKNINYIDKNAEYAIVIRKKYWGQKIALKATDKILFYGFNTLNLEKIYLNVLSNNVRAINFYKKYGFKKEGIFKNHIYHFGKYVDMEWYAFFKNDFNITKEVKL